MPKISYSEEERAQIRSSLLATALELMSKQGVRHTTVEQVYKKVGISRTFFYTFFSTKEELVLEALYFQHPHILALAQKLASDPALSWREAVTEFLALCCRDGKHGILVLAIEDQQFIFCRLSKDSYQMFRQKAVTAFRQHSGMFRDKSIAQSCERVHKFKPSRHHHAPRHSRHIAAVCARSRR